MKNLNQSELQYLVTNISSQITENKNLLHFYKKDSSMFWNLCDKEDIGTKRAFDIMNVYKDRIRKIKITQAKLVKIQSKIKKLMMEIR